MRNPVQQIISAIDLSTNLRLLEVRFDGAVVRFILDESGSVPPLKAVSETVESWFEKNGVGPDKGHPSSNKAARQR